jgi:hypothetical protein
MGDLKCDRVAANLLADFLEDLEESIDETLEYDGIALRCGFEVYDSRKEFFEAFNFDGFLLKLGKSLEELYAMPLEDLEELINEVDLFYAFITKTYNDEGTTKEIIVLSQQGW